MIPQTPSLSRRALLQAAAVILVADRLAGAAVAAPPKRSAPEPAVQPAVEAVEVEERVVYRPRRKPGYSAWVSLFPGHERQWYISFEEVHAGKTPLTRCSVDQLYRMGLPDGYDKSQLHMEVVLLESKDRCETWTEISRWPARFQHSAGSFAAAKTRDGRFLRGVWSCYRLDGQAHPGEILYESADGGATWRKLPALLDARFAAYPHRMKQLRDGTLVLAVPYHEMWGPGAALPLRTSMRLEAQNEMQMSLFFSRDEGRTWLGPTIIFPGHVVSETDFVELPSGDLLVLNNSIFAQPARQVVYRTPQGFVPGPMLRCEGQSVPECVVLTQEGVLVGSMRNAGYFWSDGSDDEGRTWQPLAGAPQCGYQPMIRQLDDGRILCAWHRGADDAFSSADHFIGIHLLRLQVNRRTAATKLEMERDYDAKQDRFLNAYTLTLLADGRPLVGKTVEVWYVGRYAPGYDSWCHTPIAERMRTGGKLIAATTDSAAKARVTLPEFDAVTDPHLSYQIFARFNADRSDPAYKPATTPQSEFYALSHGNRGGLGGTL